MPLYPSILVAPSRLHFFHFKNEKKKLGLNTKIKITFLDTNINDDSSFEPATFPCEAQLTRRSPA